MTLDEIKELIRVFGRSTKLGTLKIKEGDFEIEMEKLSAEISAAPAAVPVQAVAAAPLESAQSTEDKSLAESELKGNIIASPMVGTFYAAPSPDSAPFVTKGDTVKKGQTLCILEAMKIMNELEAEYDCKILEVLVHDGQPVEYDMPLFRVEKL